MKDFKKWHEVKTKLDKKEKTVFFGEREIWWYNVGVNVGYEQDGKGEFFTRPVLVLKKHSSKLFTCLALSTKEKKDNPFYHSFTFHGVEQSVIVLQIKLMDSKRLISRMGYVSNMQFAKIKEAAINLHFKE